MIPVGRQDPDLDFSATSAFDFELPQELIAQSPLPTRDASRLLVLDKASAAIVHSSIDHLGDWLAPGDLLVANNSRVIPARLRGRRLPNLGSVEVLLLRRDEGIWSALAKPAKRLAKGTILDFPAQDPRLKSARAVVIENRGEGEVLIQFEDASDLNLDGYGVVPLPPYILERLEDSERYQTVYGTVPGSAAAPTAGLHFTKELVARLQASGIDWAEVTLHVGLDTFRPVTEAKIQDHTIHREWCSVPEETAIAVAKCRSRGGRVIAVGTTSARTLETVGRDWRDNDPRGYQGFTDEFILPGHHWRLVDALLTNFHLPRSTLLMMVSALAGREAILEAYAEAIRNNYRFFSFGDAMLIR